MSNSWKDLLLKSGLPLENDIKRYLDSLGCISHFEFSYIKTDESKVDKEFTYDIDASYIQDQNFIDLMIECKYRHESVKWIFLPDKYGGPGEIDPNSFIHPIDYFVSLSFPYRYSFPITLAPLCSKGIEITPNSNNEKSITQAIYQLSYAFAPKIAESIEHQVYELLGGIEHIFYHIPIILTTAKLFRIKEDIAIPDIKQTDDINEIADEHDMLVMRHSIGKQLEEYNIGIFDKLKNKIGFQQLYSKNNSFTDDIEHLFAVISAFYCPQTILILNYSEGCGCIERFFEYLKNLINPSDDLILKIKEMKKEEERIHKEMEEKFNSIKKR